MATQPTDRPSKQINGILHLRCKTCMEFKPWNSFRAHPRSKDGRSHECIECQNKAIAEKLEPKDIANVEDSEPFEVGALMVDEVPSFGMVVRISQYGDHYAELLDYGQAADLEAWIKRLRTRGDGPESRRMKGLARKEIA